MADALLLSAPLAAAIVISLALAGFAWWKSARKVRKLFFMMNLSLAFLSACYWMELASPTLEGKLFWNGLEYVVNVTMPVLFLLYTYTFLGKSIVWRWKVIPFLLMVPVITLGLLWTNDVHHLFYRQVGLSGEPFTSFTLTYGIGFVIHSAYSLGLLFISVFSLASAYLRSSRMHRRQIMPVLAASLIPIVALAIGLPRAFPLSLTYFFVIGFTAAAVLLFIGSFKYELFDVVPLALEGIVEAVDDGIIVTDTKGRLLFVNDLLLRRMGMSREEAYAKPLSTISPQLTECVEKARDGETVTLALPGDDAIYMVKVTHILDSEGSPTSELLTLRDITEEKRNSERLRMANLKLSLLASVTRHDILNQLTIIRGYGELMARGKAEAASCERYGGEIASAGASIERQLRFIADYQSLGEASPRWQSAEKVVHRARELGLGGDLKVTIDLDAIELLADPLLESVFSILLDNTVRHGVRATEVMIWNEEGEGGEMVIVYQDNGVGVAWEDKEHIFEVGHGKGGGLGLHLAREILEVSGMHMHENGEPGKCARFKMIVPPDRWRRSGISDQGAPSGTGPGRLPLGPRGENRA